MWTAWCPLLDPSKYARAVTLLMAASWKSTKTSRQIRYGLKPFSVFFFAMEKCLQCLCEDRPPHAHLSSDTSLVMWWVFAGDTFEETSLILATSFADLLRWNGNTHAAPVQAEGNSWGPFQMPLSPQMGPGNVTCRDSLLRSDRLMLVYQLYSNLESLWEDSNCARKSSSEV